MNGKSTSWTAIIVYLVVSSARMVWQKAKPTVCGLVNFVGFIVGVILFTGIVWVPMLLFSHLSVWPYTSLGHAMEVEIVHPECEQVFTTAAQLPIAQGGVEYVPKGHAIQTCEIEGKRLIVASRDGWDYFAVLNERGNLAYLRRVAPFDDDTGGRAVHIWHRQ